MEKRKITYQLYPTSAQEERLLEALRLHQYLYNAALQERIDCYRKTGHSLSYNEQQASLTKIRAEHPEYAKIPVYATRMTLRRLDKSFKAFFRRVKAGQTPGFPRFKSLARFGSFEMCGGAGCGWAFNFGEEGRNGRLTIRGIGNIKARGNARITGKPKTSQVMHRHGKWYLSLTVECEPARESLAQKACGLDWGVEHLLTLSHEDGSTHPIPNPRYYQQQKDELTALQQAVSRKKRGSNRWRSACRKLSSARRKQANQRHHDHHRLSSQIAANYALVVTEKLSIADMSRSAKGTLEEPGKSVRQKAGLNREILDTAPAKLLTMIRYKVQETGGEFVEAPTRTLKPSQRCPKCWAVKKKLLAERTHSCECGYCAPRDAASALVMLKWGLGLGSETGLNA